MRILRPTALLALVLSACTSHHGGHTDPGLPPVRSALAVHADLPGSPDAVTVGVHVTTGQCTRPLWPARPVPTNHLVAVDPDPTGALLIHYPGMNQLLCHIGVSKLDQADARQLAAAIDAAPAFPNRMINCPMDDASELDIYLSYPGQTQPELVQYALRGCRGLTAPGRDGRSSTELVRRLVGPPA